ncbi:MAG: hypothetical protein OWQ54_07655 [Sulfolobaceae archaeon]|nr:hypothetical protein [Sulfolobaceae archaeon]
MPIVISPETILEEIKRDVKYTLQKEIKDKINIKFVNVHEGVLAFVKNGELSIYINETPYMQAKMLGKQYEYLYVIELHEYLHLLGIADEREVRRISIELLEKKFGQNSYAYSLAYRLADPRDMYLIKSQKLYGKPNTYI